MVTMETKPHIPMPNAASSAHNSHAPGALDNTAQTGNANGADWQEEVYQKIKSMKKMYLPELNILYQKLVSEIPKHSQHEKIEKLKIGLEHILPFLQLNKLDIKLSHKEKLPLIERGIGVLVNSKCPPKPASSTPQGKLSQPPMHTSQPIQIQPSQQAMMQPFAMQSPSLSNLQQNQQSTVQQSTALHQQPQLVLRQQQAQQALILHQQQASMLQQQILPAQQHQQRQQQQQLTVSHQPANSGLTSNQHTMNMLQQSKVPIQQQVLQNTTTLLPSQGQRPPSQPAHQQMISQSQLQGEMQIRVQTSGPLLQQQNVIEQQKQLYQPQRATQEASSTSSDSMALAGNVNGVDWQAEIYQKIMLMKQIYLPELNYIYQRVASKMQQANDTCASETPAMGSGRQGISCDFDWLDGSFDGLGSGWNGARISTSGLDRLGSSSDAKLSERLGLVEAHLEKVDTWLVDINKTLNNLVKIQDVRVSSYSWTSYGRAKRKHRVAEIIRKSCKRRRLGRGAVNVVSPVALRDDCDEDVQRKPDEEQKY